jgi:ABC-type multidrug transport system fused ATPase/permease subunit
MHIPAYSTIGLVGTTGSGKTTVVDIILGLIKPSSGALLVDGCVINQYNIASWQKSVGYVPQTIFLADDTIAANIAFGIPAEKVDIEAVERAAKMANLHEFIVHQLKDGYQTEIGERGVRLSGGQRQRIGIARALYHDPNVLIFDEATSALDNVTEHGVMEEIHSLARKKTIIIIAHRLSTVRQSDNLFVMDQGCIVGSGSFNELIQNNSKFREMVVSVK